MANVTVDATLESLAYLHNGIHGPYWLTTSTGYALVHGTDGLRMYKTANSGASWTEQDAANAPLITTASVHSDACWEGMVPGDGGTDIHVVYGETSGTDTIYYERFDTATDAWIGTPVSVGTVSFWEGNDSTTSITKGRGGSGNLYICAEFNNATTPFTFYRSTDGGSSWTSKAIPTSPAIARVDRQRLSPGYETDVNDIWMLNWDESSSDLTVYVYDDSADSWGTGVDLATSVVRGSTTGHGSHFFDAFLDTDAEKLIVAAWTAYDTSTADLVVWSYAVGGTAANLTDVVTNQDNSFLAGGFYDPVNDEFYVAFAGNGTETLTTTAALNVYYKVSTDKGSTWGSATAYTAATIDVRAIRAGGMTSAGGRFMPIFIDGTNSDAIVHDGNDVEIAAAGQTGTLAASTPAVTASFTGSSSLPVGTIDATLAAVAASFTGSQIGILTAGATIQSSWELQSPRVYLHDGYGNLITQLTQVRAISRAYAIRGDTAAQFEVADTDADIGYVEPNRGLIVRIESVNYPLPWVGYLSGRRRTQAGSYWFTCPARSLDGLLEERYLPVSSSAVVYGDVSDILRSLWIIGNVEATTGITLDANLEGGHTIEPDNALSLSGQDVRSMLDALANTARVEWWLEHRLDGTKITSSLQLRKHRGTLRGDVELRPGAGGNIADRPEEWTDLVGAPFRQRVIAGGDAFSSRGTALVQRSARGGLPEGAQLAAIESIHGIAPHESFGGLNPVSSREAASVVEYIRGSTGAARLAQALAQNVAPVNVGIRVQVAGGEEHHETWQALTPGNIIRINAGAPVLGTGVNRYARVLAAQPMEVTSGGGSAGFCWVPLELLGEVDNAAT